MSHLLGTAGSAIHHGAHEISHALSTGAHVALDLAAVPPYSAYYLSYKGLGAERRLARNLGTAGRVIGSPVEATFVALEALGLGGDVAIDYEKGESIRDEGPVNDKERKRYINSLHSWLPASLKGPKKYLPGIHKSGEVDWRW